MIPVDNNNIVLSQDCDAKKIAFLRMDYSSDDNCIDIEIDNKNQNSFHI